MLAIGGRQPLRFQRASHIALDERVERALLGGRHTGRAFFELERAKSPAWGRRRLAFRLDRGLRAREEGRAGPFAPRSPAAPKGRPEAKVLHVASFREPGHEMEKLHELYDRLAEARRTVGEEAIPFHKFADLVKDQVKKLKEQGSPEVAFRVAVKDGKVKLEG